MIRGETVTLRLVRESDLPTLYDPLASIETRGDYFPSNLTSESSLRAGFSENGFWGPKNGMLLITDHSDEILGEIEFYSITSYMHGFELSYQLFGSQHAGKGYTSEAVRLLADHLFDGRRINRLQLNIHPENLASKRVAEKAGFTFESIMRECWFHRGEYHDLEIWSLIRSEWQPASK